ncbi:MAG: 50S ribosomal protein L13 [Pseudomonadota bacterium]|nr:50S ribosomal protein L13 [Pseudomonadota bacterium]
MKTYTAKPEDVVARWHLIDADGLVLGRLASIAAIMLRGKHKPMFSTNIDCGDHIVVINAEKVTMTGRKRDQKTYYWHTGYPGGIKSRTAGQILDSAHPERIVQKAVERMLPKGPMGRKQFTKLKVYAGPDHPHEAQNPEMLDIASMNPKTTRRA